MSQPALIVIDVQNDYFSGGAFPLWNAEAALAATEKAIERALARGLPVVHVQHVANTAAGPAPFFNPGTEGAKIHARVLAAAPEAPVVVKQAPDAFENTTLHELLQARGVNELLLCGMMTQHCVTYTALSKRAEAYSKVTVLKDAVTTLSEVVNKLAIGGLSRRVAMATVDEALG